MANYKGLTIKMQLYIIYLNIESLCVIRSYQQRIVLDQMNRMLRRNKKTIILNSAENYHELNTSCLTT